VKKKVFVWLGDGEKPGSTYVSVKLKDTQGMALGLPFVTPAGYGMAKWGWVGASFKKGDDVPVKMVLEWLEESYRKVAPKKLAAQLGGGPKAAPAPARAPAKKARPRARPSARS